MCIYIHILIGVPAARFRSRSMGMAHWRGFVHKTDVSAFVLWCFTDSGFEGEVLYAKKIQNGCEKISTTTSMDPKGCNNEPMDLQKHPCGTGAKQISFWVPESCEHGILLIQESVNKTVKKTSKHRLQKTHGV